jgi:CIC family chloride channel protein
VGRARATAGLLLVAVAIGIVDAVVFVVFEAAVDDGSNWLWNDFAGTDDARWRVVPLAIVLSIGFSALVRIFGQARYTTPHTDLVSPGGEEVGPTSLGAISVIFVVGVASLLAGASLGPEASLMALSAAVGAYAAGRMKAGSDAQVLVLGSVGALLVAFVGSLVPLVVPVLLLAKQRQLSVRVAAITSTAGLAAYAGLFVLRGGTADGYGTIPEASQHYGIHDFVAAIVLGVVAVIVAHGFKRCVAAFARVTKRLDGRLSWPLSAAVFGAVLGAVYLAGGETIEFSGSTGTHSLVERSATYSAAALGGLVLAKMLATAWSLSSGYRGGIVFPSIYTAVATGLFVSRLASSLGGPGIEVGVVAGMLTALTGAAFALVFLLSLLPASLLLLALAGAVAAAITERLLTRATST